MHSERILIVDDDTHTREGIRQALETHYEVYVASNASEALRVYAFDPVDLVLTDFRMGDVNGVELIRGLLKKPNPPICILMTAYSSVELAVETMRQGAYDFLTKPIHLDKLELIIKRAFKERSLKRENKDLHQRLDQTFRFNQIIGRSKALMKALDQIKRVAPARSNVLLFGETGTGKELFAQAIHQNSPWSRGPFIAVNCAAISANLLESELFGHEKGAFTGAQSRRIGRFEAAKDGTLFLDEIGEIDAATQVKLLRFLENRSIERVGSHEPISVPLRLVCASNKDLSSLVAQGLFREDLFYRLSVITLKLPPLRERKEDIPLLIEHYIHIFSEQNGLPPLKLTGELISVLQAYPWPGNIRELRNFCENKVVIQRGEPLTLATIEPYLSQAHDPGLGQHFQGPSHPSLPAQASSRPTPASSSIPSSHEAPKAMNLRNKAVRKQQLIEALQKNHYNRSEAAKWLGVHRRTLHRMLNEFPDVLEH